MYLYLYIFLGVFLMTYFAFSIKRTQMKGGNVLFWLVSVLVLVAFSVFSGMRDVSVGFDVTYYGVRDYNFARCSESLIYAMAKGQDEAFFMMINYLASSVSDNFHVALVFIAFAILGFFYFGCSVCSKDVDPAVLYVSFLLMFYAGSLNLLRQSIAASVVFCSFAYFSRDRKFWAILFALVAFFFHKSSLIAFMVYYFVYKTKDWSWPRQKLMLVCSIFGMIAMVLATKLLIEYLASAVPGFEKYLIYTESGGKESWRKPSFPKLFFLFVVIYFCFSYFAKIKKIITTSEFYQTTFVVIVSIGFMFLGQLTASMLRSLMYFIPVIAYYYLYIANKLHTNSRLYVRLFVLFYSILYYFWGYDATLTYKSQILNIQG